MRRRLDLALALVHRPRILFLGEPTTGLDLASRTALWTEVQTLARDDGVTVFPDHPIPRGADALANRVAIINRGTIVTEGTPARLKAELGTPTIEVLAEFVRALDHAELTVAAAAIETCVLRLEP